MISLLTSRWNGSSLALRASQLAVPCPRGDEEDPSDGDSRSVNAEVRENVGIANLNLVEPQARHAGWQRHL